jgi:hypothetical protein
MILTKVYDKQNINKAKPCIKIFLHTKILVISVVAMLLPACSASTESTNSPTASANSPTTSSTSPFSPQTKGSPASVVIPGVNDVREIKFKAASKNSPGFFAAINSSRISKIKVSKPNSLTVSGWAVLANQGRVPDKVIVTYGDNNSVVAVAPVNLERPDVVKALKNSAYKHSGWSATFNSSTLPSGELILKAWAYNSPRKEATQLNRTHKVVVLN